LDFAQSEESARKINEWVERHSNNMIKDLISPDSLNSDTRMILVNGIYFKGVWTKRFNPRKTSKKPFYMNENEKADVDFMHIGGMFNYASLPNYDATAVELTYKGSGVSMIIILPNQRDGLSQLEGRHLDFAAISNLMSQHKVYVGIPKFKIEFDVKLNEPLKNVSNRIWK